MIAGDRLAALSTLVNRRWPESARAATLLVLLVLALRLPRPVWLADEQRGPLVVLSGIVFLVMAGLVMLLARAARGRLRTGYWLTFAAVLFGLYVAAWFAGSSLQERYVRFVEIVPGHGEWGVLGDEPGRDTSDRLGGRPMSDLDDEEISKLLWDFPPQADTKLTSPGHRFQLICTPRSIDRTVTSLSAWYVVTAGLFALAMAALVEAVCSLLRPLPTPIALPRGLFISYRHLDSGAATDRIRERLALRIDPAKIFLDLEAIRAGENIDDRIAEGLESCNVFLEVIGRDWLTVADVDGHRRIDNPHDSVRCEIERAMTLGKPIVVVLVGGAALPGEAEMPPPLNRLRKLKVVEVRRYPDFETDILRLGDEIARLASKALPPVEPGRVRADSSVASGLG